MKIKTVLLISILLHSMSLLASMSSHPHYMLNPDGNDMSMDTALSTEAYQRIPLYRFSRNDNPSHFFTALESEKEAVIRDLGDYFTLEGSSHYVIANHTLNSQPVYRMYNSLSGAHFYTASEVERDNVLASMSWFSLEGIAFYVFLSPESGTLPVHRFYVPQTGSHYFTIDEAEKNQLISSGQTIKQYDGIAWYAYVSDGLTSEIRDLIPEYIMAEIKSMGMSINVGENPPNIQRCFLCSPLLLKNTNISNDFEIGYQFVDLYAQFSNQDNGKMQVTVNTKWGNYATGIGFGGFIVGEDNKFTVFATVTQTGEGGETISLEVYSGKLTSTGVEGFEYGFVMLDDKGDPTDSSIENGQGRVFRDGDGYCPNVANIVNASTITPHTIRTRSLPLPSQK